MIHIFHKHYRDKKTGQCFFKCVIAMDDGKVIVTPYKHGNAKYAVKYALKKVEKRPVTFKDCGFTETKKQLEGWKI